MVVIPVDTGLVLRQIETQDAEELFAVADRNREQLREWLPWLDHTTEVAATAAFISHTQQVAAAGTGLHCVIVHEGRIVGTCSYNRIEAVHRRACIGYWLASEYQGRGIMSRAVSAFVANGFSSLGLNRQAIACATGNRASAAVAERCGFRFEGILREAEYLHDRFVDHRLYSQLRSERPRVQTAVVSATEGMVRGAATTGVQRVSASGWRLPDKSLTSS